MRARFLFVAKAVVHRSQRRAQQPGCGGGRLVRRRATAPLESSSSTPGLPPVVEDSDEFGSLPPCWAGILGEELANAELRSFVRAAREKGAVYPAPSETLRCFREVPFADVKVLLLGQDPYHGPGQANGLAFSVARGQAAPPSLQNMMKELKDDLGLDSDSSGADLSAWASQGVLLLNAVLTVGEEALSHAGKGWEAVTSKACRALAERKDPVVILAWGQKAKDALPASPFRLDAAHPSPRSATRGFFGSKPYSKANALLEAFGKAPVRWERALYDDAAAVSASSDVVKVTTSEEAQATNGTLRKEVFTTTWYRLDLQCPYEEKDQCKALGGRWDAVNKTWFVRIKDPKDEPEVRQNFRRWLPSSSSASASSAAPPAVETTPPE